MGERSRRRVLAHVARGLLGGSARDCGCPLSQAAGAASSSLAKVKVVVCQPGGLVFFTPGIETMRGEPEFADRVELVVPPAGDQEALLREVADADAVIGIPPPAVFDAAKKLRWVHAPISGISMPPDHPLIASDVPLTNCPDAHVPPM